MQKVDIVIAGGSFGGVAAALAAAKKGKKVLMVEDSLWIGGQVTSQGVPPDEHTYIEEVGGTSSYMEYRRRVRDYYKKNYPVKEDEQDNPYFNPGKGWVSSICHEPRVSLKILLDMLSPYISNGQLTIWYRAEVKSVKKNDDIVTSAIIHYANEEYEVEADYFIDATECGDLLPLSGTDYVTGSESKEMTGENHACEHYDPLDMQAVTWCFAVSLEEDGDYTIDKPERYDYYKQHLSEFWPGSQLSWAYPEPHTLNIVHGSLDGREGTINLFDYRKILSKDNFEKDYLKADITLVNWPQNDYWGGPLYEIPEDEARYHYNQAKEISKCFLYWLQTEADGKGYPNLKPRGDVMGTKDGFAMKPYIRESRRIISEFTVLEEHIGAEMRTTQTAETFYDSVGIGHYHLDLHPSTGQRTYIDMESYPFQIPLGSMIPIKTENLIPGCKNIGTTHITNGCYRLHPVEWNIGEVSGLLASFSLEKGVRPRDIRQNTSLLIEFQSYLIQSGITLEWPSDLESEEIEW
ncbi:FAD-dependent oxidoreductase [Vagococcus lutrae]|uniref:FAD-dependent oxidoreductase n=1 Tax=Vagococcus lutrae TaxID=81947 RepID=A0AAE9XJQ0_9ENTE|nr:FAD-dependent oxidoreductase [Vagococcus lutrae]WCG21880.1 FAD-dependent oxidoreductase [Vagococcus lutrae]